MPKLSYHLRWNNHLQNLQSLFENLYTEQSLVDVTMSCSDGLLSAHKLVLSACSPYFEHIFKVNPCKHPILILRGIKRNVMQILLEYMYAGSVDVVEEDLELLLSVATELQIKGLMQCPEDQSDPLYHNIVHEKEKTNHFTKDLKRVSSTPPLPKNADNLKWQAELVAQPSGSKLKEQESRTDQHIDDHNSPDETCTNNIKISHIEGSESGLEMFPCNPHGEQVHLKEEVLDECSFEEMSMDYHQEEESIESATDPTEMTPQALENKPTEGDASDLFCKICVRSFQNKVAYQRHMLTHSGIKPHRCTFCTQSFLRLSHLQRHIRVHTGERPYSCIKCPKQFARSDKLRQHYLFHHNDSKVTKVAKPRGRPRKHFEFYAVPSDQHGPHPNTLFPNVEVHTPASTSCPNPLSNRSMYPPLSIIPISSNAV